MCIINNHEETPEDHLSPFDRRPKVSNTEPQFYTDKTLEEYQFIKDTINSLKKYLEYYENSAIDWNDKIEDFNCDGELDDTSKLMAIKSSFRKQLRHADVYASRFWIKDQIDTLEKILEL